LTQEKLPMSTDTTVTPLRQRMIEDMTALRVRSSPRSRPPDHRAASSGLAAMQPKPLFGPCASSRNTLTIRGNMVTCLHRRDLTRKLRTRAGSKHSWYYWLNRQARIERVLSASL